MQDCDAMDDGMTDETDATLEDLTQWWAEGVPAELQRHQPFERVITTSGSGSVTTTSTVYSVATWQWHQATSEPTAEVAPKVPA